MKTITTIGIAIFSFFFSAHLSATEVGQKAPDFTLKEAFGKSYSLSKQLKKTKVVLLFYRSGDWCPVCKKQLTKLQKGEPQLLDSGAVLWAVNFDSVETLAQVKAKLKLKFPLLSDVGSKVINAYDVRNKDKDGSKQEGVAEPAIFVIERNGVVSSKLAYDGVRKRHDIEDILKVLK